VPLGHGIAALVELETSRTPGAGKLVLVMD